MTGLTYKTMEKASETDATIAERVRLYRLRVREEFYDTVNDPDALHNLIDDPTYAPMVARFRRRMRENLSATKDELLESFDRQISL